MTDGLRYLCSAGQEIKEDREEGHTANEQQNSEVLWWQKLDEKDRKQKILGVQD